MQGLIQRIKLWVVNIQREMEAPLVIPVPVERMSQERRVFRSPILIPRPPLALCVVACGAGQAVAADGATRRREAAHALTAGAGRAIAFAHAAAAAVRAEAGGLAVPAGAAGKAARAAAGFTNGHEKLLSGACGAPAVVPGAGMNSGAAATGRRCRPRPAPPRCRPAHGRHGLTHWRASVKSMPLAFCPYPFFWRNPCPPSTSSSTPSASRW